MKFILILGVIQMITEFIILLTMTITKNDTGRTVALVQTILKGATIAIIVALLGGVDL